MNIATRRRNIPAILFRATLFDAISRVQRLLTRRIDSSVRELEVWPGANTEQELGDLVNRAAWYLAGDRCIKIYCEDSLFERLDPDSEIPIPASQHRLFETLPSHIRLFPRREYTPNRDNAVLLNKWPASARMLAIPRPFSIIDPMFYSLAECNNWSSLQDQLLTVDEKEALKDISRKNFRRLRESLDNPENAYVFTTGPSLDRAREFDYKPDSARIICNSMVKNTPLLERIRPNLLVFADPVFHFGPSLYAHEFREQAIKAIERFGCFCMVPEGKMSLILEHYPGFRDRLIGMPITRGEWNFPDDRSFYVRTTKNIMTLLMVPVASSLARNVYIIGADGRSPKEKYFWKHSGTNQFEELMESVMETHPSFFRDRIYTRYYTEHCRIVAEQIEHGEANGVHYYSMTPSEIPALKHRLLNPVRNSC
jgi:hypothetical protein